VGHENYRDENTFSRPMAPGVDGLVSKLRQFQSYRHFPRWRARMSFSFFYISVKVYRMVSKSGYFHCFCGKKIFSLSKVGFSRLLSLPWIFKFSVAPLIDSLWSLTSWITFGSIAMSLVCFISAFMGVRGTMIFLFCVLWMNLTSALQDVAVDAFASSLLKHGAIL